VEGLLISVHGPRYQVSARYTLAPIEERKNNKKVNSKHSGLPKLIRWLHALSSDQNSGLPNLLRWLHALGSDRSELKRRRGCGDEIKLRRSQTDMNK
jgi:hypothetical protein